MGNAPWAEIAISHHSETARHDWRDFQAIKNDLVGATWEAIELYPSEDRLLDPCNRFYLWAVPPGVLLFGFKHRLVVGADHAVAPQRPLPGQPPRVVLAAQAGEQREAEYLEI